MANNNQLRGADIAQVIINSNNLAIGRQSVIIINRFKMMVDTRLWTDWIIFCKAFLSI